MKRHPERKLCSYGRLLSFSFIWLFVAACSLCAPLFAESSAELNNQSVAQFNEGNFQEALDTLNRALTLSPDRAMIFNNRGVIKAAMGDYFGALSDYNKAISLQNDPMAVTFAYFNRGNLKKDKEDYEGAIIDYNRAIVLDPKYALAYKGRAEAKNLSSEIDMEQYIRFSNKK